MGRIVTSPLAESDLDDIWFYIALDNPGAADRFLDKIDDKLKTFSDHPISGRLRSELADGLRSFPIDAYVVYYLPLKDGLHIIRVLHGARDHDKLFSEDP